MRRPLLAALILLLPMSAFAAMKPSTFLAAQDLSSASPSGGNAYAAGATVLLTAPVAGDLSAFGGSVVAASPITGDALFLGGSVSSRASVGGDLRAAAGSLAVEDPVAGDLAALAWSVHDSGKAGGSVFVIALNAELTGGAGGPVTVYGNNVALAGDFAGDVRVVAAGRVSLAPNTRIRGALTYQSPEEAAVAPSARIDGGVHYTNASYLPDVGTSRALVLLSVGFFLILRVLGALLLAGLLTGLFPKLADAVVERAYLGRPRTVLLTMLLGFAILAATPVFLFILALTFVGLGVALLVGMLYLLLIGLSFIYAGILLGGLFARRFARRETVLWRDGILGMLVVSLVAFIPFLGPALLFILSTFAAGTLLLLAFNFAFPREAHTPEML